MGDAAAMMDDADNQLERRAMSALSPNRITYLPGSFNKRFGRSMAELAAQEAYTLTDKQRALLWSMVWRYRRQIRDRGLVFEAAARRDEE